MEGTHLLHISKHLTHNYIQKQLSEWFKCDVNFIKYETGDNIGKGESYLSDIHRIKLYGKISRPENGENSHVTLDIIIKSFPKNIAYRKTFRSKDFFKNEINFYTKVLPELLEFQYETRVKDPFDYFPKLFAAVTDGENDFLALEDLSTSKYKSMDRQHGLDLDHCKMILECFAKFHALSFAFKHKYPQKFTHLTEQVFETYYSEKYWEWYKNFWMDLCECAVDAVEKEYPGTIYAEKIKEFATRDTFMRMAEAVAERGETAVFTHGDSWTPNFLMKYDESDNVPAAVKMIDFQWARPASPVLDISVFIYACTTEDLRKHHYFDLLFHYHRELSEQIRNMNVDPEKVYSSELFLKEVKKYSFHGLGFSIESTPVLMLKPEETFDMDSIQGEEPVEITKVWIIKPMKSKEGRLRLSKNIIHGVDNGYI